METVKIKNIKTGVVKDVNKRLASDYIGTGDYVLYVEASKVVRKPVESKKNVEDKD